MIGVGVIGCGYWGPNHVRNLSANPSSRVLYACDLSEERLAHVGRLYPATRPVRDYQEVLRDPAVDAVVVATPVSTHARIALDAFRAGKHVLVEKPMTASVEDALRLIEAADRAGKILMVGHTFLYASAVRMIQRTIAGGVLGRIHYVSMQRLNLGLFQTDYNVVWDLAPHDVSILLYLLPARPVAVSVHGRANVHPGVEDVAMMTLRFDDGMIAFLHFSWLDPKKVRQAIFVGDKKMLVYDDIRDTEKVDIYDKGVSAPKHYDTYAEFKFSYRYGEKVTPYIEEVEPLKFESAHFLECIQTGKKPLTDGANGLEVIRVLEASHRSIKNGGGFEKIG
ncbi:MAG: Gfo/Idh/MocA family oxidoreductase [Planctomycetes bacterium]|nr:Gfo/Idh/MocA family oxidoreductase [Planctomycetota bacterium]